MIDREKVAEQALALSPDDRAYLLDVIERSLAEPGAVDPEVAKAWSAEIDRRIAAYDRGEIEALDANTMIERVQKRLEERRAQRAL